MIAHVRVADGIYSYLSPAQLKELKRCLAIAYPNNSAKQKRDYVTLACQPGAAARFVLHPDFRVCPHSLKVFSGIENRMLCAYCGKPTGPIG